MGKKAREIRSAVKSFARSCGYRETELGELKPHITKAEARRLFLQRQWDLSALVITSMREMREFYQKHKKAAQHEIMERMGFLVREEILAVLDAQIFALLEVT